jgi:signal peptidase I
MSHVPKIPLAAAMVAFLVAGFAVVSALMGDVVLLPAAAIPLAAGIGILRRRVWSAYGYALLIFAQLAMLPFLVARSGGLAGLADRVGIFSIGLMALVGLLFFLAGKSLAASGAARGRRLPWILLSAGFSVPLLFLQAFVIPNGSMEDTLLIGDHILVRRFPTLQFARGDMVVFRYPVDHRQTFIKRIIGVPGDRIRVVDKAVYRNGVQLTEPYAVHKTDFTDPYRDDFPSQPTTLFGDAASEMLKSHQVNGEIVVPERSYFVLGDNRDASLDSRYWGFVGYDDLIGKPLLIYESLDQPSDVPSGSKFSLPRQIRWNRFFKLL